MVLTLTGGFCDTQTFCNGFMAIIFQYIKIKYLSATIWQTFDFLAGYAVYDFSSRKQDQKESDLVFCIMNCIQQNNTSMKKRTMSNFYEIGPWSHPLPAIRQQIIVQGPTNVKTWNCTMTLQKNFLNKCSLFCHPHWKKTNKTLNLCFLLKSNKSVSKVY